MTRSWSMIAITCLFPAAAHSADPDRGEREFMKCKSCHAIVAPDGQELVKGGKTGPNLFGVIGREIGSLPDYRYGTGLPMIGAAGAVWDEASLAAFLVDPSTWVKQTSKDPSARTKMTFKMPKGSEDIAAYLGSLAP